MNEAEMNRNIKINREVDKIMVLLYSGLLWPGFFEKSCYVVQHLSPDEVEEMQIILYNKYGVMTRYLPNMEETCMYLLIRDWFDYNHRSEYDGDDELRIKSEEAIMSFVVPARHPSWHQDWKKKEK